MIYIPSQFKSSITQTRISLRYILILSSSLYPDFPSDIVTLHLFTKVLETPLLFIWMVYKPRSFSSTLKKYLAY